MKEVFCIRKWAAG